MDLLEDQVDSLATLEERIRQAIELVERLRREKNAAIAERDVAIREAAAAREQETDQRRADETRAAGDHVAAHAAGGSLVV